MKSNNEDTYIEIPETYTRRELNAMYRKIPLKDTTSRQLRKYFNAMANLYGIIPLRKAWEIVSSQSPNLVSKMEFFAFAEIARHECENYCIMKDTELYTDGKPVGRLDWKIIDAALLYDDSDALNEVEICQQGKDYFIPPKTELLRYSDPKRQLRRTHEYAPAGRIEVRRSSLALQMDYAAGNRSTVVKRSSVSGPALAPAPVHL